MSFDLTEFAAALGVADPEKFAVEAEKLRVFLDECNRQVNLTRLTGKAEFDLKHAADSLSLFRLHPELLTVSAEVADIGCGAGFPSLILALAAPALRITAIDSTGKKIAFVAAAKDRLGLTNLRTVQGRAVELNRKPEFRRRFDAVTARAVADSARIYGECRDFPVPGGRFILYKTPAQAAAELPTLARLPGIKWRISPTFTLPEGAGERCFVEGTTRSGA